MIETHNRRRHTAYNALATSPEDSINISHGHEAGGGVFNSLYTALGGWLIESPTQIMANAVPDPAQSISQVIESMGNWALRGVMLNMCLPVSVRPTPSTSRTESPTDTGTAATMLPPGKGSSSNAAAAAAGVCGVGYDALRSPGRHDTGKQPLGLGGKQLGNSSQLGDTQRTVMDAATNTSTHSSTVMDAAAQQDKLESLRREVSCLRTTLGSLYLAYAQLQQENQRLRSGDGGEELLSDALQQLLTDKSALQQEVSRLSMQNKALQELLDYAAAPAASNEQPWNSSNSYCWQSTAVPDSSYMLQACCGSSSNLYDMQQAAAGGGVQQQQQCGYWLATPAGSVTQSRAASGRNSPEDSSANSCSRRACSPPTGVATAHADMRDELISLQPETAGAAMATALTALELDDGDSTSGQEGVTAT